VRILGGKRRLLIVEEVAMQNLDLMILGEIIFFIRKRKKDLGLGTVFLVRGERVCVFLF